MGGHGMDSSGSGQAHIMDCCDNGNDPFESHRIWRISCLASQQRVQQSSLCMPIKWNLKPWHLCALFHHQNHKT